MEKLVLGAIRGGKVHEGWIKAWNHSQGGSVEADRRLYEYNLSRLRMLFVTSMLVGVGLLAIGFWPVCHLAKWAVPAWVNHVTMAAGASVAICGLLSLVLVLVWWPKYKGDGLERFAASLSQLSQLTHLPNLFVSPPEEVARATVEGLDQLEETLAKLQQIPRRLLTPEDCKKSSESQEAFVLAHSAALAFGVIKDSPEEEK